MWCVWYVCVCLSVCVCVSLKFSWSVSMRWSVGSHSPFHGHVPFLRLCWRTHRCVCVCVLGGCQTNTRLSKVASPMWSAARTTPHSVVSPASAAAMTMYACDVLAFALIWVAPGMRSPQCTILSSSRWAVIVTWWAANATPRFQAIRWSAAVTKT